MKHIDNLTVQTDEIKVKDKKIKPARLLNEDTLESVSGGIGIGPPLTAARPLYENDRQYSGNTSQKKDEG